MQIPENKAHAATDEPLVDGETRRQRLMRLLSGEPRLRLAANMPERRSFTDEAYREATRLAALGDEPRGEGRA